MTPLQFGCQTPKSVGEEVARRGQLGIDRALPVPLRVLPGDLSLACVTVMPAPCAGLGSMSASQPCCGG